MSYRVVIPSGSPTNLVACIRSILAHEPDMSPEDFLVISDKGAVPAAEPDLPSGIPWIEGPQPFNFSRNVNLGFTYAEDDDVIVLGDDGLLETDHGFTKLAECSRDHPEYGIISAACNNVGNPRQNLRPGEGLRVEPDTLCFVCVYITRFAISTAGHMDEQFAGYGEDDRDMSIRVRKAGLKLGVFDGCFVNHNHLPSVYKETTNRDFRANRELFIEKWGSVNP